MSTSFQTYRDALIGIPLLPSVDSVTHLTTLPSIPVLVTAVEMNPVPEQHNDQNITASQLETINYWTAVGEQLNYEESEVPPSMPAAQPDAVGNVNGEEGWHKVLQKHAFPQGYEPFRPLPRYPDLISMLPRGLETLVPMIITPPSTPVSSPLELPASNPMQIEHPVKVHCNKWHHHS